MRYHAKAIMTIAIAGAALMQNSVVLVDAASAAQAQHLKDNGTAAKVTLTWWTWTTNPQAVIANFERAHPSITVQPPPSIGAGSPFLSKLITSLENGTGPCLTQVPYYNMPQFMASKSLDNITQYAMPEKALFPGWTWAQVSQKGDIYGIPEDIGPMGLNVPASAIDQIPPASTQDVVPVRVRCRQLAQGQPVPLFGLFRP